MREVVASLHRLEGIMSTKPGVPAGTITTPFWGTLTAEQLKARVDKSRQPGSHWFDGRGDPMYLSSNGTYHEHKGDPELKALAFYHYYEHKRKERAANQSSSLRRAQ